MLQIRPASGNMKPIAFRCQSDRNNIEKLEEQVQNLQCELNTAKLEIKGLKGINGGFEEILKRHENHINDSFKNAEAIGNLLDKKINLNNASINNLSGLVVDHYHKVNGSETGRGILSK